MKQLVRLLLVAVVTSGVLLAGVAGPALAAPAGDRPGYGVVVSVTKASCCRYARADDASCRTLPPIPYVRQACWAAAAGTLAACLARAS